MKNAHVKVILLLQLILFKINSSLCQLGFAQISAVACSIQYGPCKTTNLDLATPTPGTRCLTCFDDAFLYSQSTTVTCIPYMCTLLGSGGVSGNNQLCQACQNGYRLSPNRSCILNATSTTPSTNSTIVTPSNTPDNVTASLIISAAGVIIFILWVIFKVTTERYRGKKD